MVRAADSEVGQNYNIMCLAATSAEAKLAFVQRASTNFCGWNYHPTGVLDSEQQVAGVNLCGIFQSTNWGAGKKDKYLAVGIILGLFVL